MNSYCRWWNWAQWGEPPAGRDRPHSSWFDSCADTGALRWQRLSWWVAIASLFALFFFFSPPPHRRAPLTVRRNERWERQEVSHVTAAEAQTGTSDNSHTADFTPCHQPPHLKQIYRAAALLLDSVWLQQIRDRWANRISRLTSGTFSHPAISQCHFGIISLLAMIHDWNSFWPWVLRENVWHAVEEKWEMVAWSRKKKKKLLSAFCWAAWIIKSPQRKKSFGFNMRPCILPQIAGTVIQSDTNLPLSTLHLVSDQGSKWKA